MTEQELRAARRRRVRARRIRRTGLLILTPIVLIVSLILLLAPGKEPDAGGGAPLLTLVNPWHALPEGLSPTLAVLTGGQSVDARVEQPLRRLFQDADSAGYKLTVASGYRTTDKQQSILDERVAGYTAQGMSEQDARAEAANWVAAPGYSEHQLGLAVDLNDTSDGPTDGAAYQWLSQNAHRYGFILRYPADKTELTGTAYEPWHFRYVGEEDAAKIFEQGVCLEEYLAAQDQ